VINWLRIHESLQHVEGKLALISDVDEDLRLNAYSLFVLLESNELAPPFRKTQNPVITVIQNGVAVAINTQFFDRKRIECLVEWTQVVVPLIDLLNKIGKLPKIRPRDADYFDFVTSTLGEYYDTITQRISPQIVDKTGSDSIRALNGALIDSIRAYLSGDPHAAYDMLDEGITPVRPVIDSLADTMQNQIRELYKMRTGGNAIYSEKEMFHIPFEKRGLVKTNRYSIPGLPCVYLGSTTLICWEELGRPDLNSVQTSVFVANEDLRFLDIALPPGFVRDHLIMVFIQNYGIDNLAALYSRLSHYLLLWPLIFASSIRVRDPNDAFKPEYIVPQLLLQWVRRNGYDGICYFSTKIDEYTMQNSSVYRNYAFPVQSMKNEGHCDILSAKFGIISKAVPWQMYQVYRNTGSTYTVPFEKGLNLELELYPGAKLSYSQTDFGRLQEFFDRTVVNQVDI
jgi:hypothetical protein